MLSEEIQENNTTPDEQQTEERKVFDSSIQEVAAATNIEFEDKRRSRIKKLLDNLDSTQDSIVGASTLIG